MEPEVQALVEQHKPYLQPEKQGRLNCTLNGHILPATKQAVETFVNGSKFKRLKQQAEAEAGFAQYEPFLIQSKNRPEKLYCALTCTLINKKADSVKRHLKGKAFMKAKGKFETDEHDLMEEPDFETEEEAEPEEPTEGTKDAELLESIQGMDLEVEPVASEPVLEQSKKAKGKQGGMKKGSKGAPQPVTPPQEQPEQIVVSQAAHQETIRSGKRLRSNGSRPKRVKRGDA